MPEEISQKEIDKLQEFARNCLRVRSYCYLGTRPLTPINYTEEKDKFFKSRTYQPQFKYDSRRLTGLDEEIKRLEDTLINIDVPNDFRLYLEHYLEDTKNCEMAVRHIGTPEFADYAAKIFNLNSPKIQRYLNMSPEIDITEEHRDRLHSAEEIAEIFRQVLKDRYGIDHYEVIVDHFNDHTVRVGSKKVILGEKIQRFRKSIDRLITHEIESHVLQRINAEGSRLLHLTPLGERTLYSEGLAVHNEVTTGKITEVMYELYSHRVTAVRNLDYSFREIYEMLTGNIPNRIAFKMTYRVKRGLSDTSQKGGYPKDAFYLLGYIAVREYLEKGGNIVDLYEVRTPELRTFVKKYNLPHNKEIMLPTFLKQDHE